MSTLWLASGSPRRMDLLRQLGLEFRVLVPEVDEGVLPGESAEAYVARMSGEKSRKARLGLAAGESGVVLSADTVVVVDDEIFGKPAQRQEALSMLQRLSGRAHRVMTAVTVAQGTREISFSVETIVTFRQLSVKECEAYWLTGEPADKAGAYGIQGLGAILVESINGSYSNVVGLPLMETTLALREFDIDCLDGLNGKRL
ncbi:MAG: Maf family protein [Pseudomonadales bacterium]